MVSHDPRFNQWFSSKAEKYIYTNEDPIVAVQLNLVLESFEFTKWGGKQTTKRDDWLVINDEDTYTVDNDYFRNFYKKIEGSTGLYTQFEATKWAVKAEEADKVVTLEGTTAYKKGDYIVSERKEGGDYYAMDRTKFHKKYQKKDEYLLNKENKKDKIHMLFIINFLFTAASTVTSALVPILFSVDESQVLMAIAGGLASVFSMIAVFTDKKLKKSIVTKEYNKGRDSSVSKPVANPELLALISDQH